ncbi:MAG TPA: hypothetical protein VM389_13415 [Phycisphaerae bacterium]|nr:hypothetical protein [Phycisphaerae bacterium]
MPGGESSPIRRLRGGQAGQVQPARRGQRLYRFEVRARTTVPPGGTARVIFQYGSACPS